MNYDQVYQGNFLDLLFKGRNKLYGAYELRKNYDKRMYVSIGITFGLALLICFLLPFIPRSDVGRPIEFETKDWQLGPKPKFAEKQLTAQGGNKKQSTKHKTANTSGDVLIFTDDPVKANEQVSDLNSSDGNEIAKSGNGNGETNTEGSNNVSGSDNVPETIKGDSIVYQEFYAVEIEASFPGGERAWRRYLQNNLDAMIPIDNKAPSGTYMVNVQFLVSRDGSISDVKATTNHGYGMEQEAVKAIKRGPKWTPAFQNGQHVNAYRNQPITFIVAEEY